MNFLTRATAIIKLGFTTVPLDGKRATYTPQGCINRSREQAQIDECGRRSSLTRMLPSARMRTS